MHIIILNVFGAVLMAFAALYVGMKIGVWVASGKDESGGAPEIDGIVFPPLFFTFGLSLIHLNHPLPFGYLLLIWVMTTALLSVLMKWIQRRS